MRFESFTVVSTLASAAAAHGYVKWLGVDNSLYPGYNPHVDTQLGAPRIVYGQYYSNHPRYAPSNVKLPEIACGRNLIAPKMQANVRAGSNVTFGYSSWPWTHNGPVMAYIAPYQGDIAKVNVNELKFTKIAEDGWHADRKLWATQLLTANDNVTSVRIPHDLAAGDYILRHEIITLHFATHDSRFYDAGAKEKGAQHFITCVNLRVTGGGNARPAGVTFPGAYKPGDEGLYFDIYRPFPSYPIPGPALYKATGAAAPLAPLPYSVNMPIGDLVEDIKYLNNMGVQAWQWDGQTFKRNVDSVNGWDDGPNRNLTRACTVKEPCKEDMDGSNPSWGPA